MSDHEYTSDEFVAIVEHALCEAFPKWDFAIIDQGAGAIGVRGEFDGAEIRVGVEAYDLWQIGLLPR